MELLVAMLCGVWVYVGLFGTEHGGAITSTIQQLLTGTVATLTEIPTVRTEVAAGATRIGADSTTTAATRAAAAAVAASLAREPHGAL